MRIPGPQSPREQLELFRLLARVPAEALCEMRDRYGPVVKFGYGPFAYIALLGAEANRFVLSDRFNDFLWREAMSVLIPVDGDTAMVVSDGEDHRRRRKAAQAAFTTKRVHGYLDVMVEEFQREIDSWVTGLTIDALESLRRPIRRLTVRSLFGEDLDSEGELGSTLDTTISFVNLPPWQQIKVDLPWTRWHRAVEAKKTTDRIVYDEIDRRRRQSRSADHLDTLDILMAATEDDGSPSLNDQEIRDGVVSLIAASYDTIGSAAAWALHELMQNPDVERRARAEVDEILQGERLESRHLADLPYVDAVINETVRKWPPTSVSARTAAIDLEYEGYTIPAGAMVLYSPYVTHHTKELWPEPEQFRPERWLDEDGALVGASDPYTYVPFGGGFRRCIGFAFALQQLKAMLVTVLQTVEIRAAYDQLTPVGIPALHPREGLPLVVAGRRILTSAA